MAPSWGPRHWLGPEGALWRCPIARAWLTALMKPAVVGMRDRSRADTILQSARVTSKEFWFLSSGEGVKSTPLWETGSPSSAFEYFSVYRMSVLGAGDTEKREVGGWWLWWIFHKRKRGGKNSLGIRFVGRQRNVIMCGCHCASWQLKLLLNSFAHVLQQAKTQTWRVTFLKSLARMDGEVASIGPNSRFIPAMEGCLRAVEPLKAHPHFVLLFTISSFRTLQDLHGVTLSILMERLLRRREPVYSPAPPSTGVYKQSLHFHAHIRAIKNKSNAAWCKPFVNLMFAGSFWNQLREYKKKEKDKRLFLRMAEHLNQQAGWHPGERHRNNPICCTPSSFCSFQATWIFTSSPATTQYDPLSECSFVRA